MRDDYTKLRLKLYAIDQEINRLRTLRDQLCADFYRIPREDKSGRLSKRLKLIDTMRELSDARAERYSIVTKLERDAE